jgi:small-conductance mechanosensitive channel
MVKTQPGQQWALGRELRKRINQHLNEEGVNMPYPRQEVWVHPFGTANNADKRSPQPKEET